MCGRYSFAPSPKQLREELPDVALPPQLEISFNIAPTQVAYVVAGNAPKVLMPMEWGLVPHWSPDGKNSGKLINARAEGIDTKPSFREPLRTNRCLVPADSFYEWRAEAGGKKHPYRILLKNGALLLMAGIWDEWVHGDQIKRSFSIITTSPNQEMSDLHNRMPVILTDSKAQQQWLTASSVDALPLLQPLQDGLLTTYRVSDKLNKPGHDGADLQEKVEEPWRLF